MRTMEVVRKMSEARDGCSLSTRAGFWGLHRSRVPLKNILIMAAVASNGVYPGDYQQDYPEDYNKDYWAWPS